MLWEHEAEGSSPFYPTAAVFDFLGYLLLNVTIMSNIASNKKYHYIYKCKNLINNRYYYGMHSTNDLNDKYIGSGTLLKRSINKYGRESFKFEILEYYNSRKELSKREKEIINQDLLKDKFCMNLKPGGDGEFPIWYFGSKEHKQNARKARLIGCKKASKIAKEKRNNYYLNPKKCLFCNTPINYYKRIKHKFCSSSCSAKHNNCIRIYK